MELIATLTEIILDLGEIGILLLKTTIFVGRVILYIIHLPWYLPIIALVLLLLCAHFLNNCALTYTGVWVALHMTLPIIQKCGAAMAIAGVVFILLDVLPWLKILPKPKKEAK